MKAFCLRAVLFLAGLLMPCLLVLLLTGCMPSVMSETNNAVKPAVADEPEEDETEGETFTLRSSDNELYSQFFISLDESEHGIVYASAHAANESDARELLDCFETIIYPALPSEQVNNSKLFILLTYMEGHVYGYTEFPTPAKGPVVCLNALYPEALCYSLAHEYQHLNAHEACLAGDTSLSEGMDELLSDVFCEMLFPGAGEKLGIIPAERSSATKEKAACWGADALERVYSFLKEGYSEEELLSVME